MVKNNSTKGAGKKFATFAMASAILSGGLVAGVVDTSSAKGIIETCGGTNVAYIIDYTWSFSDNELTKQLEQAEQFMNLYSQIPGAKIDIYRFGINNIQTMNMEDSHKSFLLNNNGDLSQLTEAINYIKEINASNRTAWQTEEAYKSIWYAPGHPGEGEAWSGNNPWFQGTNWDAPLTKILDQGHKYDNILFSTDGSPNKWTDDVTKAWVESGTNTYDQNSFEEAARTADALKAKGQRITPIFVETSENELGGAYTPERKAQTTEAIKLISSGGANAQEGWDYFSTSVDGLANALYTSATASCATDLVIDKELTTGEDNIKAGEYLEYTLTVRNDSVWTESKAVVTDNGGAGLDPATIEIFETSKGSASGATWEIGELTPGESVTAKVRVKTLVDIPSGSEIINHAKVTGLRPDLTPENNEDSSSTRTPSDDVKIAKKLSTTSIRPGSALSWTITAKNASNKPAHDVYISDNSVKGVQEGSFKYVSGSAGKQVTGAELKAMGIKDTHIVDSNVYWYFGTMEAGATATVEVSAVADMKATAITNTADIFSRWDKADSTSENVQKNNDSVDEDSDNRDKTEDEVIPFVSKLQIAKSLLTAKEDVKPGGELSYKITVRNDGADADPKVVVTESPDANMDASTMVITPENGKGTATGTTWNVGELLPGEEASAIVTVKLVENADPVKGIQNKVTVDGEYFNPKDQCEPNNGDVKADTDGCDITSLKIDTNVKIVKNAKGEYAYGEEGTWEVTVKNFGQDVATNTYVTELPLEGIDASTLKLESPSMGKILTGKELKEAIGSSINKDVPVEDDKLYWLVGDLASQQEATVLVKAMVVADGSTVTNTATVDSTWSHFDPKNSGEDNETVDKDVDKWDKVTFETKPYVTQLKVNKDLVTPKAELKPGGDIEYTITAMNDSKFDDTNVVVSDIPDENIVKDSMVITSEKGSIDKDGNWVIGDLKAGEVVTATVKAKLADTVDVKDKDIQNKATITGDHDKFDPNGQCEPNNGDVKSDTDNCDLEVTKINSDLKIAKTSTAKEVVMGEKGTWEITVLNEGEDASTNVWVADLPLEGIKEDSVEFEKPSKGEIVQGSTLIEKGIATAEQVDPNKSYWLVGTLEGNERASVKLSAEITAKAGEEVKNTTITSSTFDQYDPNGPKQENETPEEDTDNYDADTIKVVEKPAAPQAPAPSNPATPVVGEKPAPQGVNTGEVVATGAGILGALGLGAFGFSALSRKLAARKKDNSDS